MLESNEQLRLVLETKITRLECYPSHARLIRKDSNTSRTYNCVLPESDEEIRSLIETLLHECS